MANATDIELHVLMANGAIDAPTPQVLDTGSDDVVLPLVSADLTRTILVVANAAAEALEVTIEAGDLAIARLAQADHGPVAIAQGAARYFGPFESARWRQADGSVSVRFSPGGTIAAEFTAFQLPTV
jgi:hypothetical protein